MGISGCLGRKKIFSELEKFLQLSLDGLFITSGFFFSLKLAVTCMFNANLAARDLLEVISFWWEGTTDVELHAPKQLCPNLCERPPRHTPYFTYEDSLEWFLRTIFTKF